MEQKITCAWYLIHTYHTLIPNMMLLIRQIITRLSSTIKLKIYHLLHIFTNYNLQLVSIETGETYRKLSEENIRLQAEVLQYKVLRSFIIVFFSLTCFGDAKHAEGTLLP